MLPKRQEKKKRPILKCRECGHEKRVGSSSYKVEHRVDHSPREMIVVVEETDQSREEVSEDERRERRKAILEHFESED
ncbi:MAG: hypothetical protein JSW61_06380 [Candidatus Thorarchaeota archaeon]|nr:MAG: hypothetical protein JSW61_06380 [Candidatus Thorarchaeota archaeon]